MRRRLLAGSLVAVLAAAALAQEPDTFVRQWLVAGAFAVDPEHEPLGTDHLGGEANVLPRQGGRAGDRDWFVADVDARGRLNFVRLGIEPPEQSVVYAHVYVFVPQEVEARLLVGSDDGVAVRVNGNRIHEHLVLRGWRADQDTVRERLGAGWNTVLCKVFNNLGGYALSLRVVGPDGEAIPGLRYAADRPDDFRLASVPSWYELEELGILPHARLSADGRLSAVIQARVRPHGTTPVAALLCTLQVGERRYPVRRTKELRGDPLVIQWHVPLLELLRLRQRNQTLHAVIDWRTGRIARTLAVSSEQALGPVLEGVEITELFQLVRSKEGIRAAGVVNVPEELAVHDLRVRITPPDTGLAVQCNGVPLARVPSIHGPWQAKVEPAPARFSVPRHRGEKRLTLHFTAPPIEKARRVFLELASVDYASLKEDLRFGQIYSPEGDFGQAALWKNMEAAFLAADAPRLQKAVEEFYQRSQAIAEAMKADTIHAVGNAHIDMAWLWRWPETVEVCEQTFRQALAFMGMDSAFTYAQSQAQAYEWMERFHPDVLAGIKAMVERGQWLAVGGMWVEPDCNLPSGEALVRQLLYGKQYLRKTLGVDVRVAWTPDTFGYAWTLPQIYKKSGIDYFVTTKLWWNDTTPPEQQLFWWESPDGSRILAVIPRSYVEDLDEERTLRTLCDFAKDTGVRHCLVLYGVGDHGGGPTQQMLARFDHMAHTRLYPTVLKSSAEAFFHAAEKHPDLPVVRDELYLQTHRGTYTTQGLVKKQNRQMEALLETAEKFVAFAPLPYPEPELRTAWKGVLFNQFHDILPGSSIPEVYKDAHALYDTCRALAGAVLDSALAKLSAQADTRGEGFPLVVFNPLSWERNDLAWVRVPPHMLERAWVVVDKAGKMHAVQPHQDGLLFEVSGVPGMGFKVFWLRPAKSVPWRDSPHAEQWKLTNGRWELEFDQNTGNLASLREVTTGRQFLAGPSNELQFFEDLPAEYDAWNIGYTGREWRSDPAPQLEVVAEGPVRATMRVVRTFGSSRFVQDISVYRRLPRIDIATRADWHETHVLAKAAFSAAVSGRAATYEIPYGWIQRTTSPTTPAEKAMYEVPAQKWIDLTDDRGAAGVSLLNDCKYGHDVRGNVMRITLLRSPKNPDPNADMGEHEFVYSLYPHTGGWQQAETHRRAYELNCPLRVVWTKPHRGELGTSCSFVEVNAGAGVMLTAVKQAEEGSDLVLRLCELFGARTPVTLRFTRQVREAWETDLLERPTGGVQKEGSAVAALMQPFEIKTLRVRFAQ
ncbi:MAG: glycosyl hydrolase-related protein [candidate division KSB1 bacterium]|nr:glycosyl hydrolase-related protein [candidate division KSB1 bacterium]